MYISGWILAGLVIAGIMYLSKSKQQSNGVVASTSGNREKFSYRLAIHMEPNWFQILKKIHNPKDEKEWEKIQKKLEKIEKNNDEDMCGRKYSFIEYYDVATGLTTRVQITQFPNGKKETVCVDEFSDRGYIFESERPIGVSKEEHEKRDKFAIDIGENYVRNNIWDEVIGGAKYDFDYKEEDYIYWFPLHEVFNFLYALGTRFHGAEGNTVIKWPDGIEEKLKQSGIKYETYFDYEPKVLDIEEYDKEFFQKMGKPKISSSSSSRFHSAFLNSDQAFYSISLKIFRPDENDRISENFTAA